MIVGYIQKKNILLITHLIQSNLLTNIMIKKIERYLKNKH